VGDYNSVLGTAGICERLNGLVVENNGSHAAPSN
jgi:hypothetical protein